MLPAPAAMIHDVDPGAEAQRAFYDLHAVGLTDGVLATGTVVRRDLCGMLDGDEVRVV
jgi:hypothetical protein